MRVLAGACICSGSFLKREGRPRDDDVLVARLVDRPIRPMFDKGWCNETQVGTLRGLYWTELPRRELLPLQLAAAAVVGYNHVHAHGGTACAILQLHHVFMLECVTAGSLRST